MIQLVTASEIFGVKEKAIKRFSVLDYFNNNNKLEGWISLKPNETYGSLILDTVNDKVVPTQYIRAMPKLHYPFYSKDDGTRVYTWPEDWDTLVVSEKWDGTNICHYRYKDANEKTYWTFKTRLVPVAGNSELFGNFGELVQLVQTRKEIFPVEGYATCYELCGYRNPHLVGYKFDIDMIPLCSIRQYDGTVFPFYWGLTELNPYIVEIDRSEISELTEVYNLIREQYNKVIEDSETEQGEFPVEGKVFYIGSYETNFSLVKCKPQIIEDIHFARGGVATHKVREACYKALEAYPIDSITIRVVEDLLLEDWHEEAVKCSQERIERELNELKTEAKRRYKIRDILTANNMELKEYPKGEIMRFLAPNFERSDMRRVFNSVNAMGLIGE